MDNYQCEYCRGSVYKEKPELTRRLGIPEGDKFRVISCTNCTLHSLFPLPTDEELYQIYSHYAFQGDRFNLENKRLRIDYPRKLKKVRKYFPTAKTIFDIGAGLGTFLHCAQNEGFEVYGLELEEEQVKLAKEKYNILLECIPFEEFMAKNTMKYDSINLSHVMEHLRHPYTVLEDVYQILNKNGVLLIEVPNQFFNIFKEIKIKFKVEKPKKSYNSYHHLYFYDPFILKKMIAKAGFKIVETNELLNSNKGLKRKIAFIAHFFKMGISSKFEIIAIKE